jgi:exosome complex component RRP41
MSSMSDKPDKLITDDGLRLDGRRTDEIRPMKIEIGVLSRADGSCYLEWGKNKVLVGVFGPREVHPRRTQRADTAVIRYKYNMASFSVEDRARPGPSRRSIEISKVSREAFEPVIMTELFPKTAIDIFVEVLQADAGTRTAAINASSVALADAGIPMKGLITSCAFGKVDGQVVLDLNKEEDNYGEADFPVAMTQDGEITLLQMDGHLTPEEIKKGLELVKKGCKEILEIQQAVLRKKFETPVAEAAEEAEVSEETESRVSELEAPLLEPSPDESTAGEAPEDTDSELEEAQPFEEVSKAGISAEETPESDNLEEIIKEAETVVEVEAFEEVIEAEIEEEEEEEALEEEAEFEASFEAAPEPEDLEGQPCEEELVPSAVEEEESEPAEIDEGAQLGENIEHEELVSEEALESEQEIEPDTDTNIKDVPADELIESEATPVEEKREGPWKVVKDPSESGSRGENE